MAAKHPAHPPSPYAIVRVAYGSENKHLYSSNEWRDDFAFFPDLATAAAAAREAIEEDPNTMIALLKVEELIAAKIEVQTVSVGIKKLGRG